MKRYLPRSINLPARTAVGLIHPTNLVEVSHQRNLLWFIHRNRTAASDRSLTPST